MGLLALPWVGKAIGITSNTGPPPPAQSHTPPLLCILCFRKDFCIHLPHGPHRIAPLLQDSYRDPVPISICPKSHPQLLDPVQCRTFLWDRFAA